VVCDLGLIWRQQIECSNILNPIWIRKIKEITKLRGALKCTNRILESVYFTEKHKKHGKLPEHLDGVRKTLKFEEVTQNSLSF
jgi:hypothetical protein